MGYSNAYLRALVIKESLMLAVLGFGPAFLLSLLLYRLTSDWANLPIVMTYKTGSLVFFLTAAMCLAAGLAVIRRLSSADPASLF
jgi:putative ABC transport system permease protein